MGGKGQNEDQGGVAAPPEAARPEAAAPNAAAPNAATQTAADAPQTAAPRDLAELWDGLYGDLKRMARARLRRSGHITLLDTTGLVNDAYLRIAGAGRLRQASPGEFMAYAARTMRSVVIDLVRERDALRRGGDLEQVTLNTALIDRPQDGDPLRIDEALTALAAVEPRLAEVVEMRYFGGFTEAEIGEALGRNERTIRRDWEKARLLLAAMLDG